MTRTKGPLEALRDRFNGACLLTLPEEIAPYLSEPRGVWPGKALAVGRPTSRDEASALLQAAYALDFAIVPMGGNTGLVGGQTLDHPKVLVLSTERLRSQNEVDPIGNRITLSAGFRLQEAQASAAEAGRLFPLSLSSEGSCTIGGNLATNAGGTQVLAYGNMRDLTLGVEALLPTGERIDALRPLRKDNCGYDLKHLLIGSEGTLAVITAASLKLFPRPKHRLTFLQASASAADVFDSFIALRDRFGSLVTAAELMPRSGFDFVLRHFPDGYDPMSDQHAWYGLVELSSPLPLQNEVESWLMSEMEKGRCEDLIIAQNSAQADKIWAIRHHMSRAQAMEGASIKHDISLPLDQLKAFLPSGIQAMLDLVPAARPVTFGHVGDGNLHFNLSAPKAMDREAFMALGPEINEIIHDLVLSFGGSIAAEHGIGRAKTEIMKKARSATELRLYREVKASFDPKGLMNPGALLS